MKKTFEEMLEEEVRVEKVSDITIKFCRVKIKSYRIKFNIGGVV